MPEGDTIHKIAAAMAPVLRDAPVDALEFAPRHGPPPRATRVLEVGALGKHLFLHLDGGHSVRVHLGMYGSWHRYHGNERWRKPARRASLVLRSGARTFVCFSAKEVAVLATPSIAARNVFDRLGPDLAEANVDLERAVRRARDFNPPGTLLADVLLDQRAACGIGNVYKCELLFLFAAAPDRTLGETSDADLHAIYRRASELLRRNLGGGKRVTRPDTDGRGRLWVYGRHGEPCLRCADGRIERAPLGRDSRSTWWCPACQVGTEAAWQVGR